MQRSGPSAQFSLSLFLPGFVYAQPLMPFGVTKTCADGRGSAEAKIDLLVRKWGKELSGLWGHPFLPKARKSKEGMWLFNTAMQVFPSTWESQNTA